MSDLAAFLLARIADDDQNARDYDDDGTPGTWSHWALAQNDAKRRVVELHSPHPTIGPPVCQSCSDLESHWVDDPCETLRLLSVPYADHPDYPWKRSTTPRPRRAGI